MTGKVEAVQLESLESPTPVVPEGAATETTAPGVQGSPQEGAEGAANGEAAAAKERGVAERLAFLRRREVLARRSELEAKARTEGLEAKLKEFESKAQAMDQLRDLFRDNPLVALEKAGIDESGRKAFYEKLTNEFIENKSPYEVQKRLEAEGNIKELREQMDALKKAIEDRKVEDAKRSETRMQADAIHEIASFLRADEAAYELTASQGKSGAQIVLEVAKVLAKDKRHTFKGDAEAFSQAIMKEAADKTEAHFEAEAMKLTQAKKLRAKLGLKDAAAGIKTLTNALNGSPVVPKTFAAEDDVLDAAIKAFRQAKRTP